MDLLYNLITPLKKEEVRHFKLFASRSHASAKRKDLKLFDYIRKNPQQYNEEKIKQVLGQSDNSWYRLRNRLAEDLNKSLWLQHIDEDEFGHNLYLLSLAQLHFNRRSFHVAHHYLKRAEREALKREHYHLLELVYRLFTQLADKLSFDPAPHIRRQQENRKKLDALNAIDDLLAILNYRIKMSPNTQMADTSLLNLLQEVIDEHTADPELVQTPAFRIKIYEAVSKLLLQREDYQTLEIYLTGTYEEFEATGVFSEKNHRTRLRMLTFLVNTLFKNGQYEASLAHTAELKREMEAYQGQLREEFVHFYYNALVQNYFILDEEKAIAILNEVKGKPELHQQNFTSIFIYLNLAMLHYKRGAFRDALRSLIELYLFDEFKRAEAPLKLQVSLLELAIRYLKGEHEQLPQLCIQLKKRFHDLLEQEKNFLYLDVITLISQLSDLAFEVNGKKQQQAMIKDFLKDHEASDSPSGGFFLPMEFVQTLMEK
ncbi:MAG: hypothetical protein AAGI38_16455 [Bacteroidota bacterium]